MKFKKYRRSQIAQLAPVTKELENDLSWFEANKVSISEFDKSNGSPKIGDMIARNPQDHADMWLVAEKYFSENYEPYKVSIFDRIKTFIKNLFS